MSFGGLNWALRGLEIHLSRSNQWRGALEVWSNLHLHLNTGNGCKAAASLPIHFAILILAGFEVSNGILESVLADGVISIFVWANLIWIMNLLFWKTILALIRVLIWSVKKLKGIKLFFSSVFWSLYLLIQPLGSNDLPQDEGVPLTRMNDNHSFHNFVSSDICKYLLTQGGWKNFNEN